LILESNGGFQEACHKGKEVLKQMEGLLFKVFHLLVHHGRPPGPSAITIDLKDRFRRRIPFWNVQVMFYNIGY
jgi:hypothetical protein